jgi:hypothetical protein
MTRYFLRYRIFAFGASDKCPVFRLTIDTQQVNKAENRTQRRKGFTRHLLFFAFFAALRATCLVFRLTIDTQQVNKAENRTQSATGGCPPTKRNEVRNYSSLILDFRNENCDFIGRRKGFTLHLLFFAFFAALRATYPIFWFTIDTQ